MSRRNKLVKFTENLTFPNVYEFFEYGNAQLTGHNGERKVMKGKWHDHFSNDNPITLELACGRGEYCLALAERYPERNFLGVDVKGARIWKGATTALERGLDNVAFLRSRIECLDSYIDSGEIQDIWITFPDPFLKAAKYNRRLTSPNFLKTYHKLLSDQGLIHLKTDSPQLYDHTMQVLTEYSHDILISNEDIYAGDLPHPDLDILTYYERMHLEDKRTIKYVQFKVKELSTPLSSSEEE